MGKATKMKTRPVNFANHPTAERMRRDDWADVDPRTLPGGQMLARAQDKPRRAQSRVRRLEREGYITCAEAAALERYEVLIEQAGYGSTRSCCDDSPRGGGGPEAVIDRLSPARGLLARARNSVRDQVALIFVDAILMPFGCETMDDVTERMIAGARAHRREIARAYIHRVAWALVVHFQC